jgi:hypothetical protein
VPTIRVCLLAPFSSAFPSSSPSLHAFANWAERGFSSGAKAKPLRHSKPRMPAQPLDVLKEPSSIQTHIGHYQHQPLDDPPLLSTVPTTVANAVSMPLVFPAGRIVKATGIPQQRSTTLIERVTKRSPSWLVSRASASSFFPCQSLSTPANKEALHSCTTTSRRFAPRLASAS